ncbi:MAG: hypothetical protein SNG10_02850 [Rikenellaceae bacterium]
MEFENIIKFVWMAVIVIVFVASNVKRKRQRSMPIDDPAEGGVSESPVTLETLLREVQSQAIPTKVESATSPKPRKIEREVAAVPVPDEVESSVQEDRFKRSDFDLRKAVIAAEILTPKFKDQ